MESEITVRPWYREPWPWFILGILSLGPIFGLGILTIGLSNPPEIVSGDHAPLGRALVDTNQRTAMARSMGLSGALRVDGGQVWIELGANDLKNLPDSLLVKFVHPATSDGDTTAVVHRNGDNQYMGELAGSPSERSRIVVSDLSQTWWLGGRMRSEPDAPDEIRLSAQRL
ncbi:FixH family protein [Wenzhouxiangella sp. AB-CW3]|uniref:FixH family protein n=1 Tax=Wenzhouxiangella sp. AB-CW3 TaxID=2771012 RepID=UPI00168AAD84|nr:FixH family protein [Wenzhouxiangella sp. AB-CW3]QOC22255.1 FixH family protein [Wenzhouxiangella sp. AB-CW3]